MGENAEEIQSALSEIFGCDAENREDSAIEAKLQRDDGFTYYVSGGGLSGEIGIFVEEVTEGSDSAAQVKAFHKHRFRRSRCTANLFDCIHHCLEDCQGESNAILPGFYRFLEVLRDDRPLFPSNFLERLDASVDLRAIL